MAALAPKARRRNAVSFHTDGRNRRIVTVALREGIDPHDARALIRVLPCIGGSTSRGVVSSTQAYTVIKHDGKRPTNKEVREGILNEVDKLRVHGLPSAAASPQVSAESEAAGPAARDFVDTFVRGLHPGGLLITITITGPVGALDVKVNGGPTDSVEITVNRG
jgi:hypothetical protein